MRVDGQKLDDAVGQQLVEARIQENLRLPDACLLRFTDPDLETIDPFPLHIGSQIEVLLVGHRRHLADERLQGDDRLARARVRARRHDRSASAPTTARTCCTRRRSAADLPEHDRRGHRAQGRPARGRRRGDDRRARGPAHDFVQQNNETDWEFLWKLAQRIDFEVLVIDHKLYFRKAGPPAGTQDITLKWGDNLISFKPRITGVQQVDQVTVRARNPARKRAVRGDRERDRARVRDRDPALRRRRGAEGRDDGRRRPARALAGGGRPPREGLRRAPGRRLPRGRGHRARATRTSRPARR